MFKINQTYGYESGFYLGTPDHNYLYDLDIDLYENYYLGWERRWALENTTAWNYRLPYGATTYDIIFGKVSPESNSLQWITNVDTNNGYLYPLDPQDNTVKTEHLYNRDQMRSVACSPYGGLVLVVATTYYVTNVFDADPNNQGGVIRIIIYGINGVTGDVQYN